MLKLYKLFLEKKELLFWIAQANFHFNWLHRYEFYYIALALGIFASGFVLYDFIFKKNFENWFERALIPVSVFLMLIIYFFSTFWANAISIIVTVLLLIRAALYIRKAIISKQKEKEHPAAS